MRSNSREGEDIRGKQQGDDDHQIPSSSSTRQWTSVLFRNPRIVRGSRGKDRHSKVCTVRGLRDRRIRLSVPTAIQLYNLQDKLGLNRPSKVIDWLLEAAKDDIDKLPPLQFYPNLIFGSSYGESLSENMGFFDNWGSSRITRSESTPGLDKGKWIKYDDQIQECQVLGTSSRFCPILLNNPTMPAAAVHNSSSVSGHSGNLQQWLEFGNVAAGNINNIPSAASGREFHQLFFCPPAPASVSSLFPTHPSFTVNSSHHEDGSSHLQLLSSSSQQILLSGSSLRVPFHHQLMNVNPGFGNQENNDNDSN